MSVIHRFLAGLCFVGICHIAQACPSMPYEMAVKYQQHSAEIQALQLQSYELATLRLKEILKQHPDAKNLAIVTDLDETVIDNSALFARDLQTCHDYTKWDTWKDWETQGHPLLIAGSLDFLNFATAQGVKIFYVSDRTQANKNATIQSLQKLQLPQVNEQSVLLLDSNKQQRRENIAKNHQIVMLIGDSLPDFSTDFNSKQNKEERKNAILKTKQHFGHDWIVLPNASYGTWSKDTLKTW